MRTTFTALSHVYWAIDLKDITKDIAIVRLVIALVKFHTEKPVQKSFVLLVENFATLFLKWGSSDSLIVKQLRFQAITMLALPKANHFDTMSQSVHAVLFMKDIIRFLSEGLHVTVFFVFGFLV